MLGRHTPAPDALYLNRSLGVHKIRQRCRAPGRRPVFGLIGLLVVLAILVGTAYAGLVQGRQAAGVGELYWSVSSGLPSPPQTP